MLKLEIEKIKHESIVVFETKAKMLKYISKLGFENGESLIISRYRKKWMLHKLMKPWTTGGK